MRKNKCLAFQNSHHTTLTIDDVLPPLNNIIPKADFGLIRRAYAFGAEAHKEQKRLFRYPYNSHPLAVAHILTQLKIDAMTIASALLHDTIEDTGVTAQQVAERFGNDVAVLVEGVLSSASSNLPAVRNVRRRVFARWSWRWPGIGFIGQLADRLHNLRTLEHSRSLNNAVWRRRHSIFMPHWRIASASTSLTGACKTLFA